VPKLGPKEEVREVEFGPEGRADPPDPSLDLVLRTFFELARELAG
jgi:hypothetical protein